MMASIRNDVGGKAHEDKGEKGKMISVYICAHMVAVHVEES